MIPITPSGALTWLARVKTAMDLFKPYFQLPLNRQSHFQI